MASPLFLSREQARTVVDDIRIENGGITAADRERTPAAVLKALEVTRRKLGAATQTLATNLYSKETRFVFEIIQNAEDNNYSYATSAGKDPAIEFTLNSDTVQIDTNEDGFTERDVRAICSTGESTKTFSSGYIGEKGIGFKSVFKVASNVHIQSGSFSFYFEYGGNDGGLGMVTPHYQDHKHLPLDVRTRITLRLNSPSNFTQRKQDFSDLPDTLLLFLRKLKKVVVNINYPDNSKSTTTFSYSYDSQDRHGKLTKISNFPGRHPEQAIQFFKIIHRQANHLPIDPDRPSTDRADVTLAFPVDQHLSPIVEQQHVFAYLPLRRFGFKFLIQSDFRTQASREDLLISPRNTALRDEVARAFRDAMLEFCDQPGLQYRWNKYIPDATISDPFWAQLRPKVLALLQDARVLKTREKGTLKLPRDVRYLPRAFLDEHGAPLFADLSDELYVSPEYSMAALKDLEVAQVSEIDVAWRIKADLDKSPEISRMKANSMTEDWHSRVAKHLLSGLDKQNWPTYLKFLHELTLIPLRDGSWVSTKLIACSFPTIGPTSIPEDLEMALVHSEALKNPLRRRLFSKLGVTGCPSGDVVNKIYRRYNDLVVFGQPEPTPNSSATHLHFLFWHLPKLEDPLDKRIPLLNQKSQLIYRAFATCRPNELIVDDLYFESDEDFSACMLLNGNRRSTGTVSGDCPAHFLSSKYFTAVSPDTRRNNFSWKTWLEHAAGIRTLPRLEDRRDRSKLSNLFRYIIEKRNDKVVGLLNKGWHDYLHLLTPQIVNELGDAFVPCEANVNDRLKNTHLPLQNMKRQAEEFGVHGDLPFLPVGPVDDSTLESWRWLAKLGVGIEQNVDFILDCLRLFKGKHPNANETSELYPLVKMYEALAEKCSINDHEKIRNMFRVEGAVLLPSREGFDAQWLSPNDCFWHVPPCLNHYPYLEAVQAYGTNRLVKSLFREALNIEDTEWKDYLRELKSVKNSGRNDPRIVSDLYHLLHREVSEADTWAIVREQFNKDCLVFVPASRVWVPTSICLWTSSTRISGKHAIRDSYNALHNFFVRNLNVEKPTLEIYVKELKMLAERHQDASIDRIKYLIKDLNGQSPKRGVLEDLKPCRILPVRNADGTTFLTNCGSVFAIVDRPILGRLFQDKVPILDFDPAEVHSLQPFLTSLDLDDHYMSCAVAESTSAENGSIDEDLSYKIRERASALTRCVMHHKSQKYQDAGILYNLIRASEVVKSEDILKTLEFSLMSQKISVPNETGELHVEEREGKLRLYLPKNWMQRNLVWVNDLPNKLCAYFGMEDLTGIIPLGKVLQGDSYMLERILDSSGIIEIQGLDPTEESDLADEIADQVHERGRFPGTSSITPENAGPHLNATTTVSDRGSRPTTPNRPVSAARQSSTLTYVSGHTSRPTTPSRLLSATPQPSSFTPNSEPDAGAIPSNGSIPFAFGSPGRDETSADTSGFTFQSGSPSTSPLPVPDPNAGYIGLLDRVIRASSRETLPHVLFNLREMLNALPGNGSLNDSTDGSGSVFGIRSENQIRHDTKIGAAGELFVFESLLKFNLRGFSRANWRSTIRHLVTVHPQYYDLQAWRGVETADIVYVDAEGDLTRNLIDRGYLSAAVWRDARPQYFIEVKSTISKSSTEFFMSKAQFNRMQNMRLPPDRPASQIYMIMRVYKLGRRDMGIKVYLDPESLRQENRLKFTAESYSIVPTGTTF